MTAQVAQHIEAKANSVPAVHEKEFRIASSGARVLIRYAAEAEAANICFVGGILIEVATTQAQ